MSRNAASSFLSGIPERQIDQQLFIDLVCNHGINPRVYDEKYQAELITWEVIKRSPEKIKFYENATEAMAISVVQDDSSLLPIIPEHLLTECVYLSSIQNGFGQFRLFPKKFMNRFIAAEAIEENKFLSRYLPASLMDRDILIECVLEDPSFIPSVPKSFLDSDFFSSVFSLNPGCVSSIFYNLERICGLRTHQINQEQYYKKAKETHGVDFQMVALEAIKANGHIALMLPSQLLNDEIMSIAIESNPYAVIGYSNKNFNTKIIMRAIEIDKRVCAVIPGSFIDKSLALFIIDKNPSFFSVIPDGVLDMEICIKAVVAHPGTVEKIPEMLISNDEFTNELRRVSPATLIEIEKYKKSLASSQYDSESVHL